LVSVATGPAAFWQDLQGRLRGETVSSRLTVSWPGGGTNLAGLNEQLHTNEMVLFTPRMGRLYSYRPSTNRSTRVSSPPTRVASGPPVGGFLRPPGGREVLLEHSGSGPWLPLRVGRTYEGRVVGIQEGFTNMLPGRMLLSIGSNFLSRVPPPTMGAPITINVATEPDLTGVQSAMGTGPMLVRDGKVYDVNARMNEQPHPRTAIGWNERHLFLTVCDGRQPDLSVGIRLIEMADFMVQLGCREAINMDGGMSTTLMLNGATINYPTPISRNSTTVGHQRNIKNAIVILRRHGGPADNED
jgi:hypothetical protein